MSEFNSNDVTIKLGLDIDENNLIASLNSVLNTANDISEKGLHIGFDTDGLQQTLNKVLKNGKIDVDAKAITESLNNDVKTIIGGIEEAYTVAQKELKNAFQNYTNDNKSIENIQAYRNALSKVLDVTEILKKVNPNKVLENISLDSSHFFDIKAIETELDKADKTIVSGNKKLQKDLDSSNKQLKKYLSSDDGKKILSQKKEEVKLLFDDIANEIQKNDIRQTDVNGKEIFDFNGINEDLKKSLEQKYQIAVGTLQDYSRLFKEINGKNFSFDTTNEFFSHNPSEKNKDGSFKNKTGSFFTKGDIKNSFGSLFSGSILNDDVINNTKSDAETLFTVIKEKAINAKQEINSLKESITKLFDKSVGLDLESAADKEYDSIESNKEDIEELITSIEKLKNLTSKEDFNNFFKESYYDVKQLNKGYENYSKYINNAQINNGSGNSNANKTNTSTGTDVNVGSSIVSDTDVENAEKLSNTKFNAEEVSLYLTKLQEISPILSQVKIDTDELKTSISLLSKDLSDESFNNFISALNAVKTSFNELSTSLVDTGLKDKIGEIREIFETGLSNIKLNTNEVGTEIEKTIAEKNLTLHIGRIDLATDAIDNFISQVQEQLNVKANDLSVKVNLDSDKIIKPDTLAIQPNKSSSIDNGTESNIANEIQITNITLTPEAIENLRGELLHYFSNLDINTLNITDYSTLTNLKEIIENSINPLTINSLTTNEETISKFSFLLQELISKAVVTVEVTPHISEEQINNVNIPTDTKDFKTNIDISKINAPKEIVDLLKNQIEQQISPIDISEFNVKESIEKLKIELQGIFDKFDFKIGVKNNLISNNTLNKTKKITKEITDVVCAIELETEAYNNASKAAIESAEKQVEAIRKITEAVKQTQSELGKLDITITQTYGSKETNPYESSNNDIPRPTNKKTTVGDTGKVQKELDATIINAEKYLEIKEKTNKTSLTELSIEKKRKECLEDVNSKLNIVKTNNENHTISANDLKLLEDSIKANNKISEQVSKISKEYTLVENEIKKIDTALDVLNKGNLNKNSNGYINAVAQLNAQKKELLGKQGELKASKDGSDFDELAQDIQKITKATNDCIVSSNALKKEFSSNVSVEKLNKNYSALINKMETFAQKNSKFLSNDVLADKYNKLMMQANSSDLYDAKHLTNLQKQFEQLQAEVIRTNNEGYSLKDTLTFLFEKIGGKVLVGSAVMYAQQAFREMLSNVKEIDTAMTALKKVSTETDKIYNNFLKNAGKNAVALGSTMTELINSTADFAKLGYNVQDAASLAKSAVMYSNVGDLDISTATDDLVSSLKAFGLATSQTQSIVDKFNEIGNNFALSSSDVGSGLRESASALNVAGNTIDQSIAMITGITEITQSSSEAGAALKILSLRLRGSKLELSEMGEETDDLCTSTSKLRDKIKGLSGVDIMLDDDTFKSTYQIMQEISKVYDKLTDSKKAGLLELIAGRRFYLYVQKCA